MRAVLYFVVIAGSVCATLFVLLFLLPACSLQTSSEDEQQSDTSDTKTVPFVGGNGYRGGMPCSPALKFEQDGKILTQPMLCPIPTKPEPDPAVQMAQDKGLIDPVLSPEEEEIKPTSAH